MLLHNKTWTIRPVRLCLSDSVNGDLPTAIVFQFFPRGMDFDRIDSASSTRASRYGTWPAARTSCCHSLTAALTIPNWGTSSSIVDSASVKYSRRQIFSHSLSECIFSSKWANAVVLDWNDFIVNVFNAVYYQQRASRWSSRLTHSHLTEWLVVIVVINVIDISFTSVLISLTN